MRKLAITSIFVALGLVLAALIVYLDEQSVLVETNRPSHAPKDYGSGLLNGSRRSPSPSTSSSLRARFDALDEDSKARLRALSPEQKTALKKRYGVK